MEGSRIAGIEGYTMHMVTIPRLGWGLIRIEDQNP
jgi:hypothetical protein